MIARGVLLLEGYTKYSLPGGCIGVLGKLLRLFDQYQLCCGVNFIDVPGHILLDVCGKTSCSQRHPQGQVSWDLFVGQSCARF